MGTALLLLIGGIAMSGLIALGVRRPLWSMAGAALMLGAAGYSLQGHPGLTGAAPRVADPLAGDDAAFIALRDRMLGRYTGDAAYQVASDSMMRIGDRKSAVRVLLGGINAVPESVLLWTGLGNALVVHDGGVVSPPASFAFHQAMRLSPRHPAPPFFLAMAYLRGGDFATAAPYLQRALALTPPTASYRGEIAGRLALVERFLAMQTPPPRR